MEHNLDQALSEIDRAAARFDSGALRGIRKAAMATLRSMIFERSPVDTGFYASSHDLEVNGVSKFRRRSRRSRAERRSSRMMPERADQMRKAAERLNTVRRLEDLERITIRNAAPHVNFVESGRSRQAPAGVFSVARAEAEMRFDSIQVSEGR